MDLIHSPLLNEGDINSKRDEILRYFIQTYETYEELFSVLKNESTFYERPEPLRHPLIFYYGHTATFFINKLIIAKQIKHRLNPKFESIFAIGVDEMSWDDLNESNYDWPSVQEVVEYRKSVKETVSDLIKKIDFSLPINWESPIWPIIMGIEHEKIHLETSSVLIRQLGLKHLKKVEKWQRCPDVSTNPENELLDVPGRKITVGKSADASTYGWDNEYGTHTADVDKFKASKYLVSNGEFLEFVLDDGYNNSCFWEEEGDKWRLFRKAKHPSFWRNDQGNYKYRSMLEEFDLPLNWPVDVNYHEAKAFCNWKSSKLNKKIRLPTEDEWCSLKDYAALDHERYNNEANINLAHYASSMPVNIFQGGKGFFDIVGNVWQWTETPIYPFDGFKVHPLYDDFTTPTYDGRHNLFKGGSWISTGNEATRHSRYAFRRHFIQHAGFRYIESDLEVKVHDYNYESDTQISQYCEFHYGDSYFNVDNFSKKSAQICFEYMKDKNKSRALDLGCAVGRSTFELAREFDVVNGIDFSARFIKVAVEMQERGGIRYLLQDEGELVSFITRKLSDVVSPSKGRVEFFQGDACNLKSIFNNYDLIFMGNLIDRLYNPTKLLKSIHERINVGGLLIIASPYTWMEEYTERAEWLGGFKDENGESLTTTDAITNILRSNFKKVDQSFSVEFVIRETARKFQHSYSEFSVFERVK